MHSDRDHLVRALVRGRDVRLLMAFTTHSSRAARDAHGCAPTSAALLAQGLTAGALIASAVEKNEAHVNFQVACDGPAAGLFVDARTDGAVRGYIRNPKVFFPSGPGEPLAPERGLGRKGYISVLRDFGTEGNENIYRGMVELEACELAADLERYFALSEQVDTAVGLAVLAEGEEPLGRVGGVLAQRLPQGDPRVMEEIRSALRSGQFEQGLQAGTPAGALLAALSSDIGELEILADYPLVFRCRCSRERARRAVLSMGLDEMRSLLAEQGEAELICEFCSHRYQLPSTELLELIRDATAERSQ